MKGLLGKRLKAYNELKEKLGRNPSRKETAKVWGLDYYSANGYIAYCKRKRGYIFELSKYILDAYQEGIIVATMKNVIREIYSKHGIYPTVPELTRIYGVTKQRIHQVRDKLRARGEEINIRPVGMIEWDIDLDKIDRVKYSDRQ